MELYLIGGMIKEFRIRRRLTQEDLADVCSVATISRIENGTQVPSRRLVEALFQKMGFTARSNDVPATTTELKRHNLECQMSNIVSNGHYEIKELLAEYKNCAKTMNEFEEQAYLFYSAVYDTEHGISHEKVLETYNKALNLTFADYWTVQKNKERDILLTQNELLIIANIAIEKYALGLHDEAISIMEDLKSYYEKKFLDQSEIEKHFAVILLSLALWYDNKNETQKALQICEQGILCCSKAALPTFIINKGCLIYQAEDKEKGLSIMKDGLKLLKYLNQKERFAEAKGSLKTFFGIDLKDI